MRKYLYENGMITGDLSFIAEQIDKKGMIPGCPAQVSPGDVLFGYTIFRKSGLYVAEAQFANGEPLDRTAVRHALKPVTIAPDKVRRVMYVNGHVCAGDRVDLIAKIAVDSEQAVWLGLLQAGGLCDSYERRDCGKLTNLPLLEQQLRVQHGLTRGTPTFRKRVF